LFDPKVNIEIGAWYLAKAMWRWRSYQQYETLALCEYNAGYSNTKYWVPKDFEGPVKINFCSTYNYVTKILIRRNFYKKMNTIKNPINQNNNLTKN
jgi:soluble lytic murein transglycosylase